MAIVYDRLDNFVLDLLSHGGVASAQLLPCIGTSDANQ